MVMSSWMRRLSFIMLVTTVAMPLLAAQKTPTAPGKYEAWGPDIDEIEIVRSFQSSAYPKVVVQALDVSSTPPPADADMAEKATKVLADATTPFVEGMAKKVPAVEASGAENAATPGTLMIRGRVTLMEPGSRSKRMFIGYGAGAARAAISGEIIDAATGEVLIRFTQERRSGIERFGRGSSYEEIMARNLRTIGQDVANILKNF